MTRLQWSQGKNWELASLAAIVIGFHIHHPSSSSWIIMMNHPSLIHDWSMTDPSQRSMPEVGKIKNYNHEKGFGFIFCEALNLQADPKKCCCSIAIDETNLWSFLIHTVYYIYMKIHVPNSFCLQVRRVPFETHFRISSGVDAGMTWHLTPPLPASWFGLVSPGISRRCVSPFKEQRDLWSWRWGAALAMCFSGDWWNSCFIYPLVN